MYGLNDNTNTQVTSVGQLLKAERSPLLAATTTYSARTAAAACEGKRERREDELSKPEKAVGTPEQQQMRNKFEPVREKNSAKHSDILIDLLDPVKTQVAKVSYNPRSRITTRSRNSNQVDLNICTSSETALISEVDTTATSMQHQQEDFATKKQERDQEIKEIQEMLSKISKSPQKSQSTSATLEEVTIDSNSQKLRIESGKYGTSKIKTFQRSSTDLQLHTESKKSAECSGTRISRRDTTNTSVTAKNQAKRRSKSSQLPLTATTHSAVATSKVVKKSTYNPEEARRYMEVQKKKRKASEAEQAQMRPNLEKEEIKKRLEDLKKNTRKLVNKNLEKKMQQKSDDCKTKTLHTKELQNKPETSTVDKKQNKANDNELTKLSLHCRSPFKVAGSERANSCQILREEISKPANCFSSTVSLPLGENQKRIGLLRKTEDEKDYSFSVLKGFNLGKENKGLEDLTGKTNKALDNQINNGITETTNNFTNVEAEKEFETIPTQGVRNFERQKNKIEDKHVSDLEAYTKKAHSSTKNEKTYPRTRTSTELITNPPKSNDLPYLLRPSTAQVYPYNFIMAVRRKLEAVTQPNPAITQQRETTHSSKSGTHYKVANPMLENCIIKRKLSEHQEEEHEHKKSRSDNPTFVPHMVPVMADGSFTLKENKGSSVKTREISVQSKDNIQMLAFSTNNLKAPQTHKAHVSKSEISIDAKKCAYAIPTFGENPQKILDLEEYSLKPTKTNMPCIKQKSVESITSEFSSVSLQIPLSNTLTEVSSLRTDSRRTYTHSSGKLSQLTIEDEDSLSSLLCSPEKKYHKQQQTDFEFVKPPRPVSPLSLEMVDRLKIRSRNLHDPVSQFNIDDIDHESRDVHFSQLLEDFNRSLSQVIQVNEQLKSTLDKSHRILSPRTSKQKSLSSEADRQYSSVFENSPQNSVAEEKLKRNIKNNNETLKQRKKLFEITSNVGPMLSPQNISIDSNGDCWNSIESLLPKFDLDINLKAISHSSVEISTSAKTSNHQIVGSKLCKSSGAAEQSEEEYEKCLADIEHMKEATKQTPLKQSLEKPICSKSGRGSMKYSTFSRSAANGLPKSKKSNMSIYTLEDENGFEKLKEIKPRIGFKSETTQRKCNKKEHENKETSTDSLREQNRHETLVLYQRRSEMEKQYQTVVGSSQGTKDGENQKDLNEKYVQESAQKTQRQVVNSGSNQSHGNDLNMYSEKQTSTSKQSTIAKTYSSSHTSSEKSPQKSFETGSSSQSTKIMDESEVIRSDSQRSEVESLLLTNKSDLKRSPTKEHQKDATTSSIEEDLQNTFETASQDNENIPSMGNMPVKQSRRSVDKINYDTRKSEQASLIKSHINSSRGDFQNVSTNEALLNETQFQLAVKQAASSQTSSTELAQSADDEVTSSVISMVKEQQHFKLLKTSKYNATGICDTKSCFNPAATSPKPLAMRRISIGNEIVNLFDKYDIEKSSQINEDTVSESSLNYSNVGLYDKLIQNEMTKSEYLTAFLKMRKKALLDRTKGQIALLEVQKARFKAKGLVNNIAAVKKKQRGILLKMEKERDEIRRLLQSNNVNAKLISVNTTTAPSTAPIFDKNSGNSHQKQKTYTSLVSQPAIVPPPALKRPVRPVRNHQCGNRHKTEPPKCAAPILRATYELESSQALEELLQKREEDLRKRRQHVEHLMKWHQRLDEEEAEVLQLERQLLKYNNVPSQHLEVEQQQQQQQQHQPQMPTVEEKLTVLHEDSDPSLISARTPDKKRASRARKMEKRLKDIDKSLKELSHITAASIANASVVMGQNGDVEVDISSSPVTAEVEFVRTTGLKLNKLWRRLTSQSVEKYEPNRRYKLCKADLELLYEDAKMAVLRDFAQDEERTALELLEKSSTNLTPTISPVPQKDLDSGDCCLQKESGSDGKASVLEIPLLNLNFSSGHSEAEDGAANYVSEIHQTKPQGIYSPSAAEQNFKAQLHNSSASSSSENFALSDENNRQQKIENNVQMFLALTQRTQQHNTSATSLHHNLHQCKGLKRSLSDTQLAEIPKFSATTSHKNLTTAETSQCSSGVGSGTTAPKPTPLVIQHQRSKSSIVEITHIPTDKHADEPMTQDECGNDMETVPKDCKEIVVASEKALITSRPSVISSVGKASPVADITAVTHDSSYNKCPSASTVQRRTLSDQIGLDSEQRANEISCKLDEISAAVLQMSQANMLPSYPLAKAIAAEATEASDEPASMIDASNLSTDASSSSYFLNFANISTDRHSSPGSQSQYVSITPKHQNSTKTPPSLSNTTTFSKETKITSECIDNSSIKTFTISPNKSASHSKTFVTEGPSTSETFVKDQTISPTPLTPPPRLSKSLGVSSSALEETMCDDYEPDFEPDSSDETHIEDISLPSFDTTTETTNDGGGETASSGSINPNSKDDTNESENKTFCTGTQLKEPTKDPQLTITASHCAATKEQLQATPSSLPSPAALTSTLSIGSSSTLTVAAATSLSPVQIVSPNGNQLMPDIINELELRRHQLILDNEHLKQYEHVTAVPYMYVREIPNKPPPPYVPPAHGSPMTTIFPSEERIKDITYRRTHELYCELLKTKYCNDMGEKLPSVMEEQITNIYERIILDICREYLEQHDEILRVGDPTNFHSQLAFFNPPNRLRCIQDAIYKEVRSCLAMDKTQPKRAQVYSVYGQRAKQDHIGKIIIQEMYDEDDRWCNFHREESEVLQLIVEEMIQKNVCTLAKVVLLEEGGIVQDDEEVDVNDGVEIEEIECTDIQENLQMEEQTEVLSKTIIITEIGKANEKTVIYNSIDTIGDLSPMISGLKDQNQNCEQTVSKDLSSDATSIGNSCEATT